METWMFPDPTTLPEQPLLEACEQGHLSTLCELLNTRDDVPRGCGALLDAAASNGHAEIVRFLLVKYDKQQLPVKDHHALAATYSGLECYRLICEREPTLLHAEFTYQGNALQQAISRSYVDMVIYILQNGGDPGRIITDTTPLWWHQFIPIETAALCASPEIAKILIRHGASLEGTAALDLAAGVQKRMRLDMVICLVEEGADINATSRESQLTHGRMSWGPPLHSAIRAEHVEIVRYLLERGASPWVMDENDMDAFEKAWHVGNEPIAQLLKATRKV
ncbi:MAG: hypothetical protein L6R39_006550 [Caloplaca ligustica]|nr:MAG: hypothetical protein L6R39_006550 [Caloplaca ligustica]